MASALQHKAGTADLNAKLMEINTALATKADGVEVANQVRKQYVAVQICTFVYCCNSNRNAFSILQWLSYSQIRDSGLLSVSQICWVL